MLRWDFNPNPSNPLVMLAPAFSYQDAEDAYKKISNMVRALSNGRIDTQISGDSSSKWHRLVRQMSGAFA